MHGDIYDGLDLMPLDMQGWNGDSPIFSEMVDLLSPKTIIEVGSWKGLSTMNMVNSLRQRGLVSKIYCVDTWLGGLEHMTWPEFGRFYRNGYPQLYYQFISNVVHNSAQDYVVPVPNTSTIGAKYLLNAGVRAEMIYVDASHEEDDVYADLIEYSKLILQGGIIFGDDYNQHWQGVINAVRRFSSEKDMKYTVHYNNFWSFQF